MPSLRFRVSATNTNAMSGRTFNVVPSPGAIMNLWGSSVTTTDSFGLSVGDRVIMVNGSLMNIEVSADCIDYDRDWIIMNELVGPGEIFMPVTVTTEAQFLMHLRYLG